MCALKKVENNVLLHELVISTLKLFTAFWLLGKASTTLGNKVV